MGYEEAQREVEALVKRFQSLTPSQFKQYNEENTKKDFVLPLFKALGWDVYDSATVAAEEKASGGRVDYAFKLCGVSQFYLEVKPLRADLTKPEYAKQAITYAYNKGIIWAALTDFEGLIVFNSYTGRPFLNLSHDTYVDSFDDLWLLSREAFEKRLLDERAEKYGALPKRLGVEEKLYEQLKRWRGQLFSQLCRYNSHLTFSQVDDIIQRLFNRLIFIRTCEDRGIEEHVLRAALHQWRNKGGELVEDLRRIFREFDGYYDSDLFSLHPVDQVFIEAKTLEEIIDGLYEVPGGVASYDFAIIDADVLGAVYEQYLGYVAEVVKQRARQVQARLDLGLPADTTFEITDKKQKRKEQGIYYTPKWVVDYIVQQTVGRLLEERYHYSDIRNLKILDPACGSGSFLIRAYDVLLNCLANIKSTNSAELSQYDRLAVLTGNIFGVDLDMQAVEIARLNLLIRSLTRRERLPFLTGNVRRGNSLISGSEEELQGCFGDNWQAKHPFNWEHEFKDIMAQGGFDVVVGNPPYVRIQSLPRDDADYYRSAFQAASGSFDIYVLFLEKGIKLLKPGGLLGFICSSKFLKSQYGHKIQQLISKECTVENIVDLSAQTVFAEATTYPAILILRKGKMEKPIRYVSVPQEVADSAGASAMQLDALPAVQTCQEAIAKGVWPPLAEGDNLWAKLVAKSDPLAMVADRVFVGLQTSADMVYILQKRGEPEDGLVRVFSRAREREYQLESALLKPLLSGKDIGRYQPVFSDHFLLFPYRVKEGVAELISPSTFEREYPLCWQYLLENRQTLEDRESGKMRHERWYAYVYPKNLALHDRRKLAIPRLVDRLEAFYDAEGRFYLDNVDVGGLLLKSSDYAYHTYITCLLNSRLLDFCLRKLSVPFRGGFYSANRQFIEPLPIRRIDSESPEDKRMYDTLVALVDRMLKLNKQLHGLGPFETEEKNHSQREIERTDMEIDDVVYNLYGLSEEERRLVEGSVNARPV